MKLMNQLTKQMKSIKIRPRNLCIILGLLAFILIVSGLGTSNKEGFEVNNSDMFNVVDDAALFKAGELSTKLSNKMDKVGSIIEILPVVKQLLSSVTHTVYFPALNPLAVSVVCALVSSHK